MTDKETTIEKLIALGHDPQLVARTAQTAEALRQILEALPEPPLDDLKTVFLECGNND